MAPRYDSSPNENENQRINTLTIRWSKGIQDRDFRSALDMAQLGAKTDCSIVDPDQKLLMAAHPLKIVMQEIAKTDEDTEPEKSQILTQLIEYMVDYGIDYETYSQTNMNILDHLFGIENVNTDILAELIIDSYRLTFQNTCEDHPILYTPYVHGIFACTGLETTPSEELRTHIKNNIENTYKKIKRAFNDTENTDIADLKKQIPPDVMGEIMFCQILDTRFYPRPTDSMITLVADIDAAEEKLETLERPPTLTDEYTLSYYESDDELAEKAIWDIMNQIDSLRLAFEGGYTKVDDSNLYKTGLLHRVIERFLDEFGPLDKHQLYNENDIDFISKIPITAPDPL